MFHLRYEAHPQTGLQQADLCRIAFSRQAGSQLSWSKQSCQPIYRIIVIYYNTSEEIKWIVGQISIFAWIKRRRGLFLSRCYFGVLSGQSALITMNEWMKERCLKIKQALIWVQKKNKRVGLGFERLTQFNRSKCWSSQVSHHMNMFVDEVTRIIKSLITTTD